MWPLSTATTNHPEAPPSQCPVGSTSREAWSKQNLNSQTGPNRLSKEREVSSIPRWINPAHPNTFPDDIPATACPAKSAPVASTSASTTTSTNSNVKTINPKIPDENWVYPSPSSFHAALVRKDRDPQAKDMPIVVPIHNAVNERVWEQVLEWEKEAIISSGQTLEDGEKVRSKLVSFIGKPKELSPRARFKGLIGYTAPFDRHDWIVDRPLPPSSSNEPLDPSLPPPSIRVRYIIDFYTGRSLSSITALDPPDKGAARNGSEENFMPNLAFYIDTRPALDGWEGARMRMGRAWKGIVG